MSRLSPTLLALAALAVAAPAALRAQTPTAPKVFYACYVPSSGTVYRIKEVDLSQTCTKSTHVEFSWTDGNAPRLSTVFTVKSDLKVLPTRNFGSTTVACPAGSLVVGGGYDISSYGGGGDVPPLVRRSVQVDDKNGWAVSIDNYSNSSLNYFVYVRCIQ